MKKQFINPIKAKYLAFFILFNTISFNLCMLNGLDKLSDKGKSIPTQTETSKVTHSKLNPFGLLNPKILFSPKTIIQRKNLSLNTFKYLKAQHKMEKKLIKLNARILLMWEINHAEPGPQLQQ